MLMSLSMTMNLNIKEHEHVNEHVHEYEYGHANTWTKNNQRETQHNLRNNDDFTLPMARIEFFKKIPLYSLP